MKPGERMPQTGDEDHVGWGKWGSDIELLIGIL